MEDKVILVPVDFSEAADNAVTYAGELAAKLNSKILLFHASTVPGTDPLSPAYTHHTVGNPQLEFQKAVTEKMRGIQSNLGEAHGRQIVYDYVAEVGNPVGSLVNTAAEQEAQLIVAGMAKGETEDFFAVDNLLDIVERAETPVLVVPYGVAYKPPRHIVFAIAEDDKNQVILTKLMAFAKLFDAKVTVLHIDDRSSDEDKFREHFHHLKSTTTDYPQLDWKVANHEDVVEGIERESEALGADLLVMRTHRRNFIERIFERNLTKKVAASTHLPLLVYH